MPFSDLEMFFLNSSHITFAGRQHLFCFVFLLVFITYLIIYSADQGTSSMTFLPPLIINVNIEQITIHIISRYIDDFLGILIDIAANLYEFSPPLNL